MSIQIDDSKNLRKKQKLPLILMISFKEIKKGKKKAEWWGRKKKNTERKIRSDYKRQFYCQNNFFFFVVEQTAFNCCHVTNIVLPSFNCPLTIVQTVVVGFASFAFVKEKVFWKVHLCVQIIR